MKSLLLLSVCALCASVALTPAKAADPQVVINPDLSATIDGAPAGTIVDLLATRDSARPAALDKLIEWRDAIEQKKAEQAEAHAALVAQQQALSELKASLLAKAEAALAAELESGDGPKAARLREIVAALK